MAHSPENWPIMISLCQGLAILGALDGGPDVDFDKDLKRKKIKKRFCGRPTGHNFGHPLDRKQTSF